MEESMTPENEAALRLAERAKLCGMPAFDEVAVHLERLVASEEALRQVCNHTYATVCSALLWGYDPNTDAAKALPDAIGCLVGKMLGDGDDMLNERDGERKAKELVVAGLASQTELYDAMKHEVRELRAERDRLQARVAELERNLDEAECALDDEEASAQQADTIAALERGVYDRLLPGEHDIQPNWVYEARSAIKHQNENLPWLPDLLKILGWQGGTVHQALNAVSRLVESEKARRRAGEGKK
jgi:hypothetical protein